MAQEKKVEVAAEDDDEWVTLADTFDQEELRIAAFSVRMTMTEKKHWESRRLFEIPIHFASLLRRQSSIFSLSVCAIERFWDYLVCVLSGFSHYAFPSNVVILYSAVIPCF